MKRIAMASALLVAGLVFAGCQRQPTSNTMPAEGNTGVDEMIEPGEAMGDELNSITVDLAMQNNSGMSGTATITELAAGQTEVTLMMVGASETVAHPAHIHEGQCPNPGAVKYPLGNVENGTSTTLLDANYSDIVDMASNLAINVHESAQNPQNYTACGNLAI